MKIKNLIIVNDFNYVQGGASKVAIDTANILKEDIEKIYFFSAVNNYDENIDHVPQSAYRISNNAQWN